MSDPRPYAAPGQVPGGVGARPATTTGTGWPAGTDPRATAAGVPPGSVPGARRPPRRARLMLKKVDPWSVMKVALALSLALLVVGLVAVVVLYGVLAGMGVFGSITSFLHDISPGAHSVTTYAPLWKVILGTIVVGIIDCVLFTALATLGAFLYNLCADLVGGVEVTLTERD